MKLSTALPCLLVAVSVPATASAFEHVTVGVGAQFAAGANFFDKPDDQTLPLPSGQRVSVDPEYPGFSGLALGGGGMIDVRFLGDIVGIEFGILYMSHSGTAELKITPAGAAETKYDINIKNSMVHMPLLIKGATPGTVAHFVGFVGPEFVVPVGNPEAKAEVTEQGGAQLLTQYDAFGESYVGVAFGLGGEFLLPIPGVDIRLHLTLRGMINPGVSDKREERANYTFDQTNNTVTKVEYKLNWQYMPTANMGASVHF